MTEQRMPTLDNFTDKELEGKTLLLTFTVLCSNCGGTAMLTLFPDGYYNVDCWHSRCWKNGEHIIDYGDDPERRKFWIQKARESYQIHHDSGFIWG